MGKPEQYTTEQFITAIRDSGAIITTIATRVGCSWHTAQKYIREKPTVAQAYEDEAMKVDDLAESVAIRAMQQKDDIALAVQVSKWWLERRRKDKFSPRQEVSGPDGGAVRLVIDWGDDGSNPKS